MQGCRAALEGSRRAAAKRAGREAAGAGQGGRRPRTVQSPLPGSLHCDQRGGRSRGGWRWEVATAPTHR